MVYQVEYITSLHVYKHTPLKLILINVNFHIEINISEHFAENTEGWQSYKIIKVCWNSNYSLAYQARSCT